VTSEGQEAGSGPGGRGLFFTHRIFEGGVREEGQLIRESLCAWREGRGTDKRSRDREGRCSALIGSQPARKRRAGLSCVAPMALLGLGS
jgi:hypothetical protein